MKTEHPPSKKPQQKTKKLIIKFTSNVATDTVS